MRKTRALWPAALAAGLMTVVTGCTSGDAPPVDDVSLRMIIFSSNPDHLALFEGIADDFTEQSESVVSVEFEVVPAADLVTVLTTQLSSGDAPDISWLQDLNSARFINEDVLLDVGPTLRETEGYDFDDLIPSALASWTRGDALYGVPFSTSPIGMYYNAELFAAAGVQTPAEMIADGTWTWESFRTAAKAISDTQGVPGYVIDGFEFSRWDKLVPIWDAFGATPWTDGARTCAMNSPEMNDAMTFFHEMVFTDRSHPLPGQAADFWAGQAGATNVFISSANLLRDATFEWDFVPMPAGPAGQVPSLGQSAMVVYQNGNHPEQAAEFLAFLTKAENMQKLASYFVPIRESLLTAATLQAANPLLSEAQLQSVVVDGMPNGKPNPISNDPGLVTTTLNALLDEHLWQENVDIGAALDVVCRDLEPALASG